MCWPLKEKGGRMIALENEVGRKGERRGLEGWVSLAKNPCALVLVRETPRSLESKRLGRLVLCGLRFLELWK